MTELFGSTTKPTHSPVVRGNADVRPEDVYQVILHNDDRNTMDHVVGCLVSVFGHSVELATKIMLEAHSKGHAVAEVEGETEARLHRDQLRSYGLVATVEKV